MPEKLRTRAKSSKFQTPSSKEAPSSKLKNQPAHRLARHVFWGFGVLRFGTSLELGLRCLVFRSAVARKLRACLKNGLLVGQATRRTEREQWFEPMGGTAFSHCCSRRFRSAGRRPGRASRPRHPCSKQALRYAPG